MRENGWFFSMSRNNFVIECIPTKIIIIIITIKALSGCPNYVGIGYMNFILHSNLSRAKSLNRLHFFKSIITISINVLFGLPLLLGGPSTSIERFSHWCRCWPTLDMSKSSQRGFSYFIQTIPTKITT